MRIISSYKLFLLTLFVLSASILTAQNTAELNVHNQVVIGSDFYFDIYVKMTPDSDEFHLGNSDFVLDFKEENFDNPRIEKVNIQEDANSPKVSSYSKNKMIAAIVNGRIVINGLGNASSNLAELERVAPKILKEGKGTFLGRYKISSIANHKGSANLTWRCEGQNPTQLLGHKNKDLKEKTIATKCNTIPNHPLSKIP